MPQVKITVGNVKCVRQADSMGKDDVYWIANLHAGPSVDQKRTDMARLTYGDGYYTSMPEMLPIGAGETRRFANDVVFDGEVRFGSYVYGTIHFMERDTPMANYIARIWAVVGTIIGGLAVAAVVGFAIGWWMGGFAPALGGAILGAAIVGLVGFLVGALVGLSGSGEGDAHLGGMRIIVGPLAVPPPSKDKETWQLALTPSGKLDVVDEHGAELITYGSSHAAHAVGAGHRYETSLVLEITDGHR